MGGVGKPGASPDFTLRNGVGDLAVALPMHHHWTLKL